MGAGFMLPSVVFYHLAMTVIDYLTFSRRQAVNQTVKSDSKRWFQGHIITFDYRGGNK